MRGIALVIGAVHVILKRLAELPEGPEVHAQRETALGYIGEVAMWNASQPSVEMREATMKRVLALHVAVNRLGLDACSGTSPRLGGLAGMDVHGGGEGAFSATLTSSAPEIL